jgi:hypothetical protein
MARPSLTSSPCSGPWMYDDGHGSEMKLQQEAEHPMRNDRARSLTLLASLLLLPLPAQAALTQVGVPFAIVDESPCSFLKDLEVIASPEGAFEVVWVDDRELAVRGRLFAPSLDPAGPPVALLPLHGEQINFDFVGTWAGSYELAMNVMDISETPNVPWEAFRVQLDGEGDPVMPPVRVKTQRFMELAPVADGDSLQFRWEPPIFGRSGCLNRGLLARRIDESGAPISTESRVTRRASAWSGTDLVVEHLPNDTSLAVYRTCQQFTGLVARRLNANGVPLGKPINLPLPGIDIGFGDGNLVLAARGRDFVVAAMSYEPLLKSGGAFTRGVVNDKVFGPFRLLSPLDIGGVVDIAASPNGGYLLLFFGFIEDPPHIALFAQELDARGAPQGTPLAVTGDDYIGVDGAVTSLPDGRWIVVTRAQQGDGPSGSCHERLVGTVLVGD